jgi:hypothetical protein
VVELTMLAVFGLLGFLMRRFDYPIAPVVVGLILGPVAESQFRRAMSINLGDPMVLLQEPDLGDLLAIALLALDRALRAARHEPLSRQRGLSPRRRGRLLHLMPALGHFGAHADHQVLGDVLGPGLHLPHQLVQDERLRLHVFLARARLEEGGDLLQLRFAEPAREHAGVVAIICCFCSSISGASATSVASRSLVSSGRVTACCLICSLNCGMIASKERVRPEPIATSRASARWLGAYCG